MAATEKLLIELAANYSAKHGWEQYKRLHGQFSEMAEAREQVLLVKALLAAFNARRKRSARESFSVCPSQVTESISN